MRMSAKGRREAFPYPDLSAYFRRGWYRYRARNRSQIGGGVMVSAVRRKQVKELPLSQVKDDLSR